MHPAELHSRSAEENCLTENVSSRPSVKVAISELGSIAAQYCEVLYRRAGFPVLITDRDHVVAVSGISRREVLERRSPLRELPIMHWCSPLSSPLVMYAAV